MTNLTRAEIESMTPADLNRAIAEAKGWKICRYESGNEEFYLTPDGEHYLLHAKYSMDVEAPDWSGDISAAWELVEEVAQGNVDCSLYVNNEYLSSGRYKALFCEKDGRKTWSSDSDTAPLAICRAYLLWKSNDKGA